MGDDDDFEDLGRPSEAWTGPLGAATLALEIAASLAEPAGRLEIVPDEHEMAWLLRDGRRVSWLNLRTAQRLATDRRARLVRSLADLVRRYDELLPLVESLEVGGRYRVMYKNAQLRRVFRVKGVLRTVSEFRHAQGVAGGGWTLTLESKPAIGKPVSYRIDTATLVDLRPA